MATSASSAAECAYRLQLGCGERPSPTGTRSGIPVSCRSKETDARTAFLCEPVRSSSALGCCWPGAAPAARRPRARRRPALPPAAPPPAQPSQPSHRQLVDRSSASGSRRAPCRWTPRRRPGSRLLRGLAPFGELASGNVNAETPTELGTLLGTSAGVPGHRVAAGRCCRAPTFQGGEELAATLQTNMRGGRPDHARLRGSGGHPEPDRSGGRPEVPHGLPDAIGRPGHHAVRAHAPRRAPRLPTRCRPARSWASAADRGTARTALPGTLARCSGDHSTAAIDPSTGRGASAAVIGVQSLPWQPCAHGPRRRRVPPASSPPRRSLISDWLLRRGLSCCRSFPRPRRRPLTPTRAPPPRTSPWAPPPPPGCAPPPATSRAGQAAYNRQRASSMPINRYAPFTPIDLPDRTWPRRSSPRRRCGAPSTCATATRP